MASIPTSGLVVESMCLSGVLKVVMVKHGVDVERLFPSTPRATRDHGPHLHTSPGALGAHLIPY